MDFGLQLFEKSLKWSMRRVFSFFIREENIMKYSKVLMVIGCLMGLALHANSSEEWGEEMISAGKYSFRQDVVNDGEAYSLDTETTVNSFEELPILEKEEATIEKIMHALGTSSVPELIWKQKELKKMGKTINHVHPLKFIGYIISEPILRSDLQETHRNFFKWRAFLDGFRRRMTEEFYKGNLNQYLPGFCKSLEVKQEVVEHFIDRRDWEGLVKALMY
jgi:hypothetical protein